MNDWGLYNALRYKPISKLSMGEKTRLNLLAEDVACDVFRVFLLVLEHLDDLILAIVLVPFVLHEEVG